MYYTHSIFFSTMSPLSTFKLYSLWEFTFFSFLITYQFACKFLIFFVNLSYFFTVLMKFLLYLITNFVFWTPIKPSSTKIQLVSIRFTYLFFIWTSHISRLLSINQGLIRSERNHFSIYYFRYYSSFRSWESHALPRSNSQILNEEFVHSFSRVVKWFCSKTKLFRSVSN